MSNSDEDGSPQKSLSSSLMEGYKNAGTGFSDYLKNSGKNQGATKTLAAAEKSALGSTATENSANGAKSFVGAARSAEESPTSLFTGKGKTGSDTKSNALNMAKGLPILIVGGILTIAILFLLPIIQIGTIVNNLQEALGFKNTIALLEKKCEYTTAELAKSGNINEDYYERLAQNNIDVGQVTLAGEFVKTNTYLAYLDEAIATTDTAYANTSGELVFRFEGEVITADNFVAAVESNPRLYAAYSEALNVAGNYYYGDEISNIYTQLGITRNEFSSYVETDDDSKNYENFSKLVSDFLNKDNATTIQIESDDCQGNRTVSSKSDGDAASFVSSVDDATHDYDLEIVGYDQQGKPIEECLQQDGTARNDEAAILLNTAISSLEPYQAIKAFMVVVEPIQQAQAGNNGPVDQLMNMLNAPTTVILEDTKNNSTIESTESILTNQNFVAAITLSDYSKEEAFNFSRDRVLTATGVTDISDIKSNNAATNIQQSAARNSDYRISSNNLSASNNILESSLFGDASTTFASTIGANRIVEGGAFLNNKLNSVIGSLASDSSTIASYQKEVAEVIARQAAAERATLSPFDVTSQNTFLGSIVYNLSTAITHSLAKTDNNLTVTTFSNSIADVTKNAIASITGIARADNYNDGYLGTNGEGCATLSSTGYDLSGDIYCSQHETVDTQYIDYSLADFANSKIGGDIDKETGEIINEHGELMETLTLGADRGTSVGVSNAEVCKIRQENYGNIFQRTLGKVKSLLGVTCAESDSVAIGTKYTLSSHNENSEVAHLSSAYALYQMSRKIVGEENEVTVARAKYYEEYPLDTSPTGIIAYASGLSKADAEKALQYAAYLTYIANYDPSTRYVFAKNTETKTDALQLSDLETRDNFYNASYAAVLAKKLIYSDTRFFSISLA